MRTHFDGMVVAVQSQAHCLCIAFGGILWGPWVIHGPMMCRLFNKLKIIWFKPGALVQGDCARRAGVDSWSCTCVLHARVVRQQGQRGPGFWCPTDITVAILAQGTSWAVADTQAFFDLPSELRGKLWLTAAVCHSTYNHSFITILHRHIIQNRCCAYIWKTHPKLLFCTASSSRTIVVHILTASRSTPCECEFAGKYRMTADKRNTT